MKAIIKYSSLCSLIWISIIGCSRLEFFPPDAVPVSAAISDASSAQAATIGIYDQFQQFWLSVDGLHSISGLYSDELSHTGTDPGRLEFNNFNVSTSNYIIQTVFGAYYTIINAANNVIHRVPEIEDPSLSEETANNLIAEAMFLRALAYWYLTNSWGDVPLVLEPTTEIGDQLLVSNTPKEEIWIQMEEDLMFAKQHLLNPAGFRASSDAAKVLLSRLFLIKEEFQKAFDLAEEVIVSNRYFLEADYRKIFEGSTSEQIWYLNFTSDEQNFSVFWFSPSFLGGRYEVAPSPWLVSAYEPGDLRFVASIDTSSLAPYGIKYSTFADPLYMIRYSEVLLIAAEAAAEEEDWQNANLYYNMIRKRADLPEKELKSNNFVDLILQERFVEMAMEGPQRTWDLLRKNKAAEILGPLGFQEACDDLWPYPQSERDVNPNLKQNPCY